MTAPHSTTHVAAGRGDAYGCSNDALLVLPTDDDAVASGNGWDDDGFGSFQPNWNSQTNNTRRRGGQYYYPVQRGLW